MVMKLTDRLKILVLKKTETYQRIAKGSQANIKPVVATRVNLVSFLSTRVMA